MARKSNDAINKSETTAAEPTVNTSDNTSLAVIEATTDIITDIADPPSVPVNFNTGLNVTILNSSIDAIIEKSDGKTKLFVNSKAENSQPATMADLSKMLGVYGLSFDPASLDSVLTIFGISSSNLSIELSKLFFYTEFGGEAVPPTENTTTTEFAFKITINNKPTTKEMSLFAINSLSFAVWKTDRSNVLKSLNLMSVDDLLKGIE